MLFKNNFITNRYTGKKAGKMWLIIITQRSLGAFNFAIELKNCVTSAANKIIIFVITKIMNMKNLQNESRLANKPASEKKITAYNFKAILSLFSVTMLLSSCEVIGGIFKAGMGVGIFIVVVVVLIIVFFVMRAGKK